MPRLLPLLLATLLLSSGWCCQPATAAVSSIEIASAGRMQSSMPKQWLKLLAELGVTNTRLRTIKSGDKPSAQDFGTETSPRVHLVGVLSTRGVLTLPGGKFSLRDRQKLSDYLKRAGTDGAQGVTSSRGLYGLTEKEFLKVFKHLSLPLSSAPPTASLETILRQADDPVHLPIEIPEPIKRSLQTVPTGSSSVSTLSQGTALAVLLRGEGLGLCPTSEPGKLVVLRIATTTDDKKAWPIGYEIELSPSETFPKLFEKIDVEIDGYTLAEATDAIGGQLTGLPIVWDQFALRSNGIDPATLQVKLPKMRTYYKRILDKLLFQARLKGELRIDESGTPFYWITK